MPLTSQPIAIAREMELRLQPKSSLMGTTKTPTPFLAPVLMNSTKKVTASINQP